MRQLDLFMGALIGVLIIALIIIIFSCTTLPDPATIEGRCRSIEIASSLSISSLLVYKPELKPIILLSVEASLKFIGEEKELSGKMISQILSLGLDNIPMDIKHRLVLSNIKTLIKQYLLDEGFKVTSDKAVITTTLIIEYLRCFLNGAKAGCL